jgi:hypothetical protein
MDGKAISPGSRIMVREYTSDDLGRHIENPGCDVTRDPTYADDTSLDSMITPYWECPCRDLQYYVVAKVHVPERVYYAGNIVPYTVGETTRPLQQWNYVESRDEVPDGKELRVIEARGYEEIRCLACAVKSGLVTKDEIKGHTEAQAEYELCKTEQEEK